MMMMTLMMTQPVVMLLRRMDVGLLIDSSLFVLLLCRVGFGYYGCQIIRVTLIICAGGGVIIQCITKVEECGRKNLGKEHSVYSHSVL